MPERTVLLHELLAYVSRAQDRGETVIDVTGPHKRKVYDDRQGIDVTVCAFTVYTAGKQSMISLNHSIDIPNPTYYRDHAHGLLNGREMARARNTVVHISRWKTTASRIVYNEKCYIHVFDDGNDVLPRHCPWRIIGSDHAHGKLLLKADFMAPIACCACAAFLLGEPPVRFCSMCKEPTCSACFYRSQAACSNCFCAT